MPTPYFLVYDGSADRGTWATYTYVDQKNATQDASITKIWFFNYVKEASLGSGLSWDNTGHLDVSILTAGYLNAMLDVSINSPSNHQALTYDISLGKWINSSAIDISVNSLYGWELAQDASIVALRNKDSQIDSSLNTIYGFRYFNHLLDVSITDASNNNVVQYNYDASKWENRIPMEIGIDLSTLVIGGNSYATNASIGLAEFGKNASFGLYATNVSIGSAGFAKSVDLNPYATNSSIGTAGFAKNASFNAYATNASIGLAGFVTSSALSSYITITDATSNYTKILATFSNPSTNYIVQNSDINGIIDASGTFTIYLPNTLSIGFQTTIVNAGPGIITLNASTLLTIDSSTRIATQNAAASVVHKGSGVWRAFGNLT
jgi:hypothetical protein